MDTLTANISRDEANLVLYLVKNARDEAQDNRARAENKRSTVEPDPVSISFYDNRVAQCDSILAELRDLLY